MNVILFDDPLVYRQLLPLTLTRPVADIRVGILKISEKWGLYMNKSVSFSTQSYLSAKFPLQVGPDNWWINGTVCPNIAFLQALRLLKPGEGIRKDSRILAVRTPENEVPEVIDGKVFDFTEDLITIDQLWKIFVHNGAEIRNDFALITRGRESGQITDTATVVYNPKAIFVEDGVSVRAGILNADTGPIYLGKNSQVQEGAIIRGPFSLGEGSIINMGGKMRGDTTIGPGCKVGGEISNSVIFGYSNKAHDGYLGNSVLGEWCNLGADTNTSNMKNNYDTVKLWSYAKHGYVNTGLTFCGLIMGDYSKTGINTMFNTGTVVGVNSNVFGAGFQPNFVPSFAWGVDGLYDLTKALEAVERAMKRRSLQLTEIDRYILKKVHELILPGRKINIA